MLRRSATALTIPLAALALTGCGGTDHADYERDLAEVGDVVEEALEAVPQDDSEPTGPEQVVALSRQLRDAADQLADLDPPDDAARAQRRLERGLRGVAEAFEELGSDLRSAEGEAAKADLFVEFTTDERTDTAFGDIVAAQDEYRREGYRVFDPPGPATP